MRQKGLKGALTTLGLIVIATLGCRDIERANITRTRTTMGDLEMALRNYERDMGSFDAKLENGDEMPTGILKDASERAKLIRILRGKKADGTVELETRQDSRWKGPYIEPRPRELKDGQLVDAWGNPLMIRIKREKYDKMMRHRPESFEIYSFGPDAKDEHGSGDDINNWD